LLSQKFQTNIRRLIYVDPSVRDMLCFTVLAPRYLETLCTPDAD